MGRGVLDAVDGGVRRACLSILRYVMPMTSSTTARLTAGGILRRVRGSIARRNTCSKYGVAMREAILLIMLAIVSSSAAAEWLEAGSNEIGAIYYADPATIRRAGDRVKMWNLVDYKTARVSSRGMPYMSMKAHVEYDCREERVRTLYYSIHSRNMARGKSVFSDDDPAKWSPVLRGTIQEDLWGIACGKR